MHLRTETTAEWLKRMQTRSEIINAYITNELHDDTLGWGGMYRAMWNASPVHRPAGLLLTGGAGCGKHTACAQMVQLLIADNYVCFHITGDLLLSGTEDPAAVRDRVDAMLTFAGEKQAGLCLVLEQLERSRLRRELLDYLGEVLCDYTLAQARFFLILIEEDALPVPGLLRRQLRMCRFTLPAPEQRRWYLEHNAGDLRHYVDLRQLTAETEGFSFAQLVDAVHLVRALVDQTDGRVPEPAAISALLLSQRPAPGKADLRRRVLAALEHLPDALAETAAALPVRETAPATVAEAAEPAEYDRAVLSPDFLARERERLEHMDFKDFSREFFGEELQIRITQ